MSDSTILDIEVGDATTVEIAIDGEVTVVAYENESTVVAVDAATGPAGPPGVAWRGVWDSLTEYVKDDVVFYLGSSWVATSTSTVGVAPPINPLAAPVSPWNLFARGDNVSIFVSTTEPDSPLVGDIWVEVL